MPDRRAMNATGIRWAGANQDWLTHRARCRTCGATAAEPPNPDDLCPAGRELRERLAQARADYETSEARGSGWRF